MIQGTAWNKVQRCRERFFYILYRELPLFQGTCRGRRRLPLSVPKMSDTMNQSSDDQTSCAARVWLGTSARNGLSAMEKRERKYIYIYLKKPSFRNGCGHQPEEFSLPAGPLFLLCRNFIKSHFSISLSLSLDDNIKKAFG